MSQKMKTNDQGGPSKDMLNITGNKEAAEAAKSGKDVSSKIDSLLAQKPKKKGHYEYSCCGTKYWVSDE